MTDVDSAATPPPETPRRWRPVLIGLGVFVALFLAIQLVPYRVDNPPVKQETDVG